MLFGFFFPFSSILIKLVLCMAIALEIYTFDCKNQILYDWLSHTVWDNIVCLHLVTCGAHCWYHLRVSYHEGCLNLEIFMKILCEFISDRRLDFYSIFYLIVFLDCFSIKPCKNLVFQDFRLKINLLVCHWLRDQYLMSDLVLISIWLVLWPI